MKRFSIMVICPWILVAFLVAMISTLAYMGTHGHKIPLVPSISFGLIATFAVFITFYISRLNRPYTVTHKEPSDMHIEAYGDETLLMDGNEIVDHLPSHIH